MPRPYCAHQLSRAVMASIPSDAIPDLQRLGERLRLARDQQGLSREQLAERLHLGTEQLVALESADSARLHELVFVIAQARRLAAALHLDIEAEINALRRSASARGSASRRSSSRPPSGPAAPPPKAAVAAATPPAAAARGPWPWLAAGAAALLALVALLNLAVQRRSPSAPSGGDRATAPARPAIASTAPGDAASDRRAAGAAAAGRYSLQALNSQDSSWVEVRDAGGQVLFRGRLEGRQTFPIGAGLQVLAGRPDLVAAGPAGGRLQPLGAIDAVSWRRIAPPDGAAVSSAPTAPAP